MELWIRSQDKTNLILAKDIVVSDGNIKVYKDTELCTTVAMYKTKERALEILDEIENLIKPRFLISNISINDGKKLQNQIPYKNDMIQTMYDSKIEQINGSIVYQMPKE